MTLNINFDIQLDKYPKLCDFTTQDIKGICKHIFDKWYNNIVLE